MSYLVGHESRIRQSIILHVQIGDLSEFSEVRIQ